MGAVQFFYYMSRSRQIGIADAEIDDIDTLLDQFGFFLLDPDKEIRRDQVETF